MNHVDYLIIGGGIAGTTAAETIRKLDPSGTITIIEVEQEPLYSKVMLTDLLKGTVKEEQLRLRRVDMSPSRSCGTNGRFDEPSFRAAISRLHEFRR